MQFLIEALCLSGLFGSQISGFHTKKHEKEENINNQERFENLPFFKRTHCIMVLKTNPVLKLSHECALFVKHNMMPLTIYIHVNTSEY